MEQKRKGCELKKYNNISLDHNDFLEEWGYPSRTTQSGHKEGSPSKKK